MAASSGRPIPRLQPLSLPDGAEALIDATGPCLGFPACETAHAAPSFIPSPSAHPQRSGAWPARLVRGRWRGEDRASTSAQAQGFDRRAWRPSCSLSSPAGGWVARLLIDGQPARARSEQAPSACQVLPNGRTGGLPGVRRCRGIAVVGAAAGKQSQDPESRKQLSPPPCVSLGSLQAKCAGNAARARRGCGLRTRRRQEPSGPRSRGPSGIRSASACLGAMKRAGIADAGRQETRRASVYADRASGYRHIRTLTTVSAHAANSRRPPTLRQGRRQRFHRQRLPQKVQEYAVRPAYTAAAEEKEHNAKLA